MPVIQRISRYALISMAALILAQRARCAAAMEARAAGLKYFFFFGGRPSVAVAFAGEPPRALLMAARRASSVAFSAVNDW